MMLNTIKLSIKVEQSCEVRNAVRKDATTASYPRFLKLATNRNFSLTVPNKILNILTLENLWF